MVLVDWLFFGGDRPDVRVWAGITMGFIGVVLLVELMLMGTYNDFMRIFF